MQLRAVPPSADLKQTRLPYSHTALEPVMSAATIDYHYDELYGGYVRRYNEREGSRDFNKAGAFLHDIYFTQFTNPKTNHTKPGALTLDLIHRHHHNLADLKSEMLERAMAIQGSGWVYLAQDGTVKIIHNHEIRKDIVLLIDWWEHAWALDYQADKKSYFENIWRIMDWDHIESRLAGQ